MRLLRKPERPLRWIVVLGTRKIDGTNGTRVGRTSSGPLRIREVRNNPVLETPQLGCRILVVIGLSNMDKDYHTQPDKILSDVLRQRKRLTLTFNRLSGIDSGRFDALPNTMRNALGIASPAILVVVRQSS